MSVAPSFWLQQLGGLPRRPALQQDREADVCIVGGGFTGLWAAYELRRADPALEVVVLEARHVGFGASGRNGGWVLGEVSGSPSAWNRRGGAGAARAMARAIQQTVGEVGAVVEREQIQCDWTHGGSLTIAQNQVQLGRLRREAADQRELLGADLARELLDADEVRSRIAVDRGVGGLFTPHCARVQPARLVLGLAACAERLGATVYERTPALELAPGIVRTLNGYVRARFVLRATEGYTADLPGLHRAMLPLNSTMIVTEPLDRGAWASIGWNRCETLLDGSLVYTYSQRTADGRIAIGGRGVPYRFGSRTDREGPVPQSAAAELRRRLISLFPALRDVAVDRAWHGVMGVSRDWRPAVGLDPLTGLGFAGGYVGDGVAASNLAGRTLRDLVLGRDSELTRLPWVGPPARDWEPEPLRFLGARGTYSLYRMADAREQRNGHESRAAKLAKLISGR